MGTSRSANRESPKTLERYLLATLSDRPGLALSAECPTDELVLNGKHYHDNGYGNWTGFYDWLRDSNGRVIGFRFLPFEDVAPLVERAQRASGALGDVSEKGHSSMEVYFSDSRQVDPAQSDDQDFGTSKLYVADDGRMAICLDASALTPRELAGLETLVATPRPAAAPLDG